MTTPELPPLTTYDHECVDDYGDFRSKMVEDNLGEWVRVIEVEARERILRDRIAELEADAERLREVIKDVTAVGVAAVYEKHKEDILLEFSRPELQAIADVTDLLRHKEQAEHVFRRGWDAAIDAARGSKG